MHSLIGFFRSTWPLTALLFIMLSCPGPRVNTTCSAAQPPDTGLTVGQDVAYIGFGSVVAVRTSDGSQLWKTSTGLDPTFSTLANGVLYVGNGVTLTALSSSDGKQLWQFKGTGYYSRLNSGDPPLVSAGVVYVASTTQAAAVQASDGHLLWRYALAEKYPPRFALDQQTLYLDGGTTLTALQASTGQLLWQVQQPSRGFLVSALGNQVYLYEGNAVNEGNAVVALRTSDGQQLWRFPLSAASGFIEPMSAPPLTSAGGILYVGVEPTLSALRERDGQLLWSVPTAVSHPPVMANNVLYTLLGSKLSALNASTGTAIWQTPYGYPDFLLDPNRGALYVPQPGGLLALKMSDGSLLWSAAHVSGPPRLASNGTVYLAGTSGGGCSQPSTSDVYALQTSDGHTLWHVHL